MSKNQSIADNLRWFLEYGQLRDLQQAINALQETNLPDPYSQFKPIFLQPLQHLQDLYSSGEQEPQRMGLVRALKRLITKPPKDEVLLGGLRKGFSLLAGLSAHISSLVQTRKTAVVQQFVKDIGLQEAFTDWLPRLLAWMALHVLVYYVDRGVPDSLVETITRHKQIVPQLEVACLIIDLYRKKEENMRLREELDRELHLREQDLTLYQRILTDKLDESLWFARNSPFWLSIGIADVAGSTDKNVEARLLPLIDRVVKELSKEMGFEVVMMDRENNLFRFPLLPPSKVEFRAPVEELDSIEPSIAQLRFLWFLFSNPPISLKPRKTTIFEYHAVQIGEKSTNFVLIRPRYAIDRNLSEDEICYLLKRVTAQSFGRSYPHSGCLLGDKEATGVCSTCAFSFLRAKPARLFHGVSVL